MTSSKSWMAPSNFWFNNLWLNKIIQLFKDEWLEILDVRIKLAVQFWSFSFIFSYAIFMVLPRGNVTLVPRALLWLSIIWGSSSNTFNLTYTYRVLHHFRDGGSDIMSTWSWGPYWLALHIITTQEEAYNIQLCSPLLR